MNNTHKSKSIVVLLAATGTNFIGGILYIWSVISKGLVSQLSWTSQEASLPYTVATISFVIAMILFGKVQDLKGPKTTGTIGAILLGAGIILSGFTKNSIVITLTFGVITGLGIGILNISTIAPALKWFPAEKKGLITGIVVAGVGFSSVFYSPLANYLVNSVGISRTFIYLGLFALVLSIIFVRQLDNPPEGYLAGNNGNIKDKQKYNENYKWKEMLKTISFYKVWLMLTFSSSAGLMVIGHMTNITKVQIGWENGFLLVIALAIFNTLGRILGGSICDKIGRINLMQIVFILQGINMLLFARYTNIALLTLGTAIAGFCYGASFSVFPVIVSDFYGMENFGVNYGIVYTGWGVGGVIGPMVAAKVFDSTNSYRIAYMIAFILLCIALIISLTFKNYRLDE